MERKQERVSLNSKSQVVNNAFYNDLGDGWHEAKDHPIALLRAENALRNPWIQQIIASRFPTRCTVLDVGCGGGFLTNYLADHGYAVHGVDLSEKSLEVAKKRDVSRSVHYEVASAYELPFADQAFDIVCAMDLLEHVENPAQVIKEASRVLKKGGLFFFHTFNRNLLSYLIVIKGVEWCFNNAPKQIHTYPLFIKPEELQELCSKHQLKTEMVTGLKPDIALPSFWKMLFTRKVDENFRFKFTSSLVTGYAGFAIKSH